MVIKRQKLDDKSKMPWGIHQGIPIGEVDPSYLLWLMRQTWIREWPDMHDYLMANQTALIAESDESEEDEGTGEFKSMDDYIRYGRN